MKKNILLLSSILFLSFCCHAQITWEKLFVKSSTDVFRCVQEVPSGGYVAAGYTSQWSANDTDAFVVRLDINGDTLWTRSFNGGRKDLFYKVINTSDSGFVMCGYTSSYGNGSDDSYYMKIDAAGNELWHFTYAGVQKDRAQDIIQTSDGGYAMCGYTNSGTGAQGYNAFLTKLDANGAQMWMKNYGTLQYDDANSLKELFDGGFIMAGQTQTVLPDTTNAEIYLIRTNSNGDTCWTKKIGTATTGNENAECIQLASAGGFIICGSTTGIGSGNDDGYLVKTDTGGVMQWQKAFGGSQPDDFHRVENTTDGGFIVTGTTQSNALIISDQWLLKTNSTGDSTWAKTFGGANHDHAYSGLQTSDGGYILCGYTASFGYNFEDALIIKIDSSGNLFNHLVYTAIDTLVSPVTGSCGNANAMVTVTVINFGDSAFSNIPLTVDITGAITQTLSATLAGTLAPSAFINYTFPTPINTSGGGTFNFHCYTSTNNDVYPAMNSHDSSITITALPVPPSAMNDTLCGAGVASLTASSPFTINWFSSASGGTSLQSGATYSPNVSNTTTYYVQASNSCGTSTRTPVTVVVHQVSAAPTVFSAQRCGPGNVTLLASAADTISWWSASTGGTLLLLNSNTYVPFVSATTIFYVEAGVTCPSNRIAVTATVNPLPTIGFTTNAPAVCIGDAFQFTNTTTGAVSYSWNFGDGTGTSTQTNPSYTYASISSYVVRLVATSSLSCRDTVFATISVNAAPQVSFTASSTSGCAPFSASFTNTTTNAVNYLWNFGDGFTSTDTMPVHDYMTAGTFTVTLLATVGSCADSDSLVNMITVYPSPVFDFGTDSISSNNLTYLLDAGAGFSTYQWNNNSNTQTITVDTNGLYCVIVTNSSVCSDTDCVFVTLDALSTGNISGESNFIIYPNPADESTVISWQRAVNSQLPVNGSNITELKIFDATGKIVLTKRCTTSDCLLPTGNLLSGVYFVEIQSGDKKIRRKLIVY